jgi:hypothetical protein
VVKESNPEFDNTMPDPLLLRQLASDATQVLGRVSAEVKAQIPPALERTNQLPRGMPSTEADALRLHFDLNSASLIPLCMVADRKTQRNRGPVKDVWDDGPAVGNANPPRKLSTVLLVVVGLLSLEWLTRKLLKLA